MLVVASALVSVTLLTGYTLLLIHRHREDLTCMLAMTLAMGLAMMGSLLVGTLLGVLFNEMFAPTVYAILTGMAVGYAAGRPVHLMASLDGMLAGIMGGMMGAMLGVMVHREAPIYMIGGMNLIYVWVPDGDHTTHSRGSERAKISPVTSMVIAKAMDIQFACRVGPADHGGINPYFPGRSLFLVCCNFLKPILCFLPE